MLRLSLKTRDDASQIRLSISSDVIGGRRSEAASPNKSGRELSVRVEGQLAFNGAGALLEGHVQPCLMSAALVRVLSDWCPPSSGYHLFRRQSSPALSALVEAL